MAKRKASIEGLYRQSVELAVEQKKFERVFADIMRDIRRLGKDSSTLRDPLKTLRRDISALQKKLATSSQKLKGGT